MKTVTSKDTATSLFNAICRYQYRAAEHLNSANPKSVCVMYEEAKAAGADDASEWRFHCLSYSELSCLYLVEELCYESTNAKSDLSISYSQKHRELYLYKPESETLGLTGSVQSFNALPKGVIACGDEPPQNKGICVPAGKMNCEYLAEDEERKKSKNIIPLWRGLLDTARLAHFRTRAVVLNKESVIEPKMKMETALVFLLSLFNRRFCVMAYSAMLRAYVRLTKEEESREERCLLMKELEKEIKDDLTKIQSYWTCQKAKSMASNKDLAIGEIDKFILDENNANRSKSFTELRTECSKIIPAIAGPSPANKDKWEKKTDGILTEILEVFTAVGKDTYGTRVRWENYIKGKMKRIDADVAVVQDLYA